MARTPRHKNTAGTEENISGDPFISSLDELKAADIESEKAKKRSRSATNVVISIASLVFFVIFVVSMFLVCRQLLNYAKADKLYDSLAEIWETDDVALADNASQRNMKDRLYAGNPVYGADPIDIDEPISSDESDVSENLMLVRSYLNSLRVINPDLVGWITVNGTSINYPVVQAYNNQYYLTRGFDGRVVTAGTIYMDYRNEKTLSFNHNTIIYGHNMNAGTMFYDLSKFFGSSFYKNNDNTVTILTDDGVYIYRVYTVFRSSVQYNFIRTLFGSNAEYLLFANEMAEHSRYQKTGHVFTKDDRLLTLTTCTNDHDSGYRYVIGAYLEEIRR